MDDQVMPLPNIRPRHRRWKSCSNMAASLSASKGAVSGSHVNQKLQQLQQLQQQQQQQHRRRSEPAMFQMGGEHLLRHNGPASVASASAQPPPPSPSRSRHNSADDLDARKSRRGSSRRAMLLLRRQGRQLSDPGFSQGAIMLARYFFGKSFQMYVSYT